jgi:hypothetical protein
LCKFFKKKERRKEMMSKSLWLVCLWFANLMMVKAQQPQANCSVNDTELPEVQTGINNFIIDELGSILFPYALNQCTGNNVITTGRWYWYQCSMDSNGMSTVTKTEYFADDCSGTGSVIATFNETNMTEGQVGYFECSGSDAYARIRLSLDSTCTNAVVIYAALGACVNMNDNSQMNFFCSSNETIAQIFTSNPMMSTTFLPSSTQLLFNTTNLPTGLNQTILPTQFNATNLPTGLNQTILPTGFNATLPTMSTMFNATIPSMINISTSQVEVMMCADQAFCTKWIVSKQCNLVTTVSFGINQGVYGIFDECSEGGMISSSTTMLQEFNTTFGQNMTATESSMINTILSTLGGNNAESGAVRPSLLFTLGMCLSFFFLVSV